MALDTLEMIKILKLSKMPILGRMPIGTDKNNNPIYSNCAGTAMYIKGVRYARRSFLEDGSASSYQKFGRPGYLESNPFFSLLNENFLETSQGLPGDIVIFPYFYDNLELSHVSLLLEDTNPNKQSYKVFHQFGRGGSFSFTTIPRETSGLNYQMKFFRKEIKI